MANKITTIFDLDDKGFTSSLKRLRTDVAEADGFVGKMKAGATGLGDTLKANLGVAAAAAGTALVAFGVKAVGAFTDSAKSALDFGAATGIATEDASRWIAVGDDMGVTAEQLTSAFGRVGKSLDSGTWEKYGIATRDAAGEARATNDIILDTFDVLSKTTNETERARIGNALFGKGYANLAPLIGKTRKEMEGYLGAVEEGQVITDAEAARAEEWRLAMDSLQDSVQEITLAFGQFIAKQAPLLKGLAEMVTLASKLGDVLPSSGNAVQAFLFDNEQAFLDAGISAREYGDMVIEASRDAITMEEAQAILNEAQRQNIDITDKAANKADYYRSNLVHVTTAAEQTGTAFDGMSKDAKDSADEMQRAADEARDLEEAYKSLKGELDQREAWLNLEESMRQFRWDMAAGGMSIDEKRFALVNIKQELVDYLGSLEDVPAEKQTEILALIDQGKIDEAERQLAYLSRQRNVPLNPVTGGQAVAVPKFDEGGVMPGPIGQHSLALVAGGEMVLPTHKPGALPALGGGGGNVIFNANITTGAEPQAVYDALLRQIRLNGAPDLKRALGLS